MDVGRGHDVDLDAADIGFVRDLRRQNLHRHREAERFGGNNRLGGGIDLEGCVGRNVEGLEHGLRFGVRQHLAPVVERRLYDHARALDVRGIGVIERAGDFAGHRLVEVMTRQEEEGLDRLFRRVEIRNARLEEEIAGFGDRGVAHPAGQNRLAVVLGHGLGDGLGDAGGIGHGLRRQHDQDAVVMLVLDRLGNGRGIFVRTGIAEHVERIAVRPRGGEDLVEFLDGLRVRLGQVDMQVLDAVGGQDTGTAAIGDDGETLAGSAGRGRQDLGGGEELAEGLDAHGAGPFERGVEHTVRTDQGTGMGRGRLGPGGVSAGLQHDDRLGEGRDLEGRDELAGIADALDIKENRPGLGVVGQKVEHVAEIDVGRVAEREHRGKTEIVRRGPVGDGRTQGARLRDERQAARGRLGLEERAVHLVGTAGQADAVRADEAHAVMARRRDQVLFELDAFAADFTEAGRKDHGVPDAFFSASVHQGGHELCRRRDEGQVDLVGHVADLGITGFAHHLLVFGIDGNELAGETALDQVRENDRTNRVCTFAGAEYGDGFGIEESVEGFKWHGNLPEGERRKNGKRGADRSRASMDAVQQRRDQWRSAFGMVGEPETIRGGGIYM